MISIIMPTYNSSHWIIETLTSVNEQTYGNFECIIVDDGSTDNTIEVIQKFIQNNSKFQLTYRPKNLKKGPSSCRNYGCTLIKGDFIQFFDSDDIMHPEHLEEKKNAIGQSDFVLCKLKEFQNDFDYNLFATNDVPDIARPNNLFESFVCGDFPMMMVAPMWRSSVLKKYLPFDENLHILEDHELYSRILFQSKTYEIVNKTLIFYRQSEMSSMNQFYGNLQTGMDSYLSAKKSVLQLSQSPVIKLAVLKMVLGYMRMGLAQKNYKNAEKCFTFIKVEKLAYTPNLQMKIIRIYGFYLIFKLAGRGDTHFKNKLKL